VHLGVEFGEVRDNTAADLALALFRTGITPKLIPAGGEVERPVAA